MVIGLTPLTQELYGSYIVDEYDKNYAVNIRNRFKSSARHIIVANFRKHVGVAMMDNLHAGRYEESLGATPLMLFEKAEPYGISEK